MLVVIFLGMLVTVLDYLSLTVVHYGGAAMVVVGVHFCAMFLVM